MEIKERDFANLLFPVMEKGKGTLLSRIEGLNGIESFSYYKPDDSTIKYIILCYDRQSPIVKAYSNDLINRKKWAAQYAGWKPDEKTGDFTDEVDDILKCKNKKVNEMTIDFIRLFNDPEWATLMIWYDQLYSSLQSLLDLGTSDDAKIAAEIEKKKGEIRLQTKLLSEDISKVAIKLVNDENPYLRRDLFCAIDAEIKNRLNITPERRAGLVDA